MNRPCFIYVITHVASGKRYVGSTVNPSGRWITHRSKLNCGKHHCSHLQRAWKKYGAAAFVFSVLEQLPTNDRVPRAIAELKTIAAAPCYNSQIANFNRTNFENSPATRKRIAIGVAKALETDPSLIGFLKNRGAELAALIRSPEGRKRAGETTKRRWRDPVERQKLNQGLINRWAEPTARERQSKALKNARGTPEARQHNSEMMVAAWANPNSGLRNRKQTRWADPEAKARQAKKMRAYHASKHAQSSDH
jgi:group I intron endonuclease